jgi:hypothetical protein
MLRGLSRRRLAEASRVPEWKLFRAEHGLTVLRGEEIEALARVLDVPAHFLTRPVLTASAVLSLIEAGER